MAKLKSKIEASLAELHSVHGQALSVGGSLGTHLAAAGEDAAHALADHGMYLAKKPRQLS